MMRSIGAGTARLIAAQGGRRFVDVREDHRDEIVGLVLERHGAGERLVHHDADDVQVAARVGDLPEEPLGREVCDRADDLARVRDARHLARAAREPEVHHLDGAAREHHDVRRLDVAVDDVVLVRELQRFENLDVVPIAVCTVSSRGGIAPSVRPSTSSITMYEEAVVCGRRRTRRRCCGG